MCCLSQLAELIKAQAGVVVDKKNLKCPDIKHVGSGSASEPKR